MSLYRRLLELVKLGICKARRSGISFGQSFVRLCSGRCDFYLSLDHTFERRAAVNTGANFLSCFSSAMGYWATGAERPTTATIDEFPSLCVTMARDRLSLTCTLDCAHITMKRLGIYAMEMHQVAATWSIREVRMISRR